jgi:hypothetical protein
VDCRFNSNLKETAVSIPFKRFRPNLAERMAGSFQRVRLGAALHHGLALLLLGPGGTTAEIAAPTTRNPDAKVGVGIINDSDASSRQPIRIYAARASSVMVAASAFMAILCQ